MTLIIALLLGAFVCQGSSSAEDIVANASNTFSDDVYKVLSRSSGNVLFCPISAHIPLALILQGAGGATASELARGLALDSDPKSIRSDYRSFLEKINGNKLRLATRLYPRVGVTIKPDFLSIARNDFHSDVKNLDYSDTTQAAKTINEYVEEETNNTIHNLIKPSDISPNTDMVIVNAAYFKNSWKFPFKNVSDSKFYNDGKDEVDVKMMTGTYMYRFKSYPTYKVLQMQFDKDQYSMVIVLPNERNGLQHLEANMPSIQDLMEELEEDTIVNVALPKFKIEKELSLAKVLEQLGIKTLFSPSANLSGIIEGESMKVSEMKQKSIMDCNEYGVEASSATFVAVVGLPPTPPKDFKADHPFLFYLMDGDCILFQGRLTEVK